MNLPLPMEMTMRLIRRLCLRQHSIVDCQVPSPLTPPPVVVHQIQRKKRRVVTKMTEDQIRFLLESFVEAMQAPPKSRLTMNKFADLHEVKRSTFKGYLKVSGLSEMNQKGELQSVSRFVIQTRINAYLAQRATNEGKRHSSESMSFLTEEEQELLIQYASMLARFDQRYYQQGCGEA